MSNIILSPSNTPEKSTNQLRVIIIDDEERFTEELVEFLENINFYAIAKNKAKEGLSYLENHHADLLILDIRLDHGINGLDVLKEVREKYPEMEVIVVSGHGDMDTVIEALRLGAIDYLRKPFRHLDIRIAIERTAKYMEMSHKVRTLEHQNSLISEQLEARIERKIIGVSAKMRQVINLAMTAAQYSDTNVIITGESGTGKENIARIIHHASDRRNHIFCAVNSSAIPETLMESEFFGHKKGSYTGATTDAKGFFEIADGGTLFLDEIADMPLNLQAKMLRVIEEKEITRVGEQAPIHTNFRVVTATNHNVNDLVEEGRFRLDLLHRLNTLHIEIPPLRERPEDIEPILIYYMEYFCKQFKKHKLRLDENLIEALKSYSFPGNIRELRNLTERAVILSTSNVLDKSHFPMDIKSGNYAELPHSTVEETPSTEGPNMETTPPLDKNMKLVDYEENLIREALKKHNFNQSAAARALGLQRMVLVRKLQKYGLDPKAMKQEEMSKNING